MGHWTNSVGHTLSAASGEVTVVDFDMEIHPGSQTAIQDGIYDYAYHLNLVKPSGEMGPSRITSVLAVKRETGVTDAIRETRAFCELDSGAEEVLAHTGRTPLSVGDEVIVRVNLDDMSQSGILETKLRQRMCSLTLDLAGGVATSGNFAGTAFPTDALAGRRYYRTDLSEGFDFTGEKWLGSLRSDGGGRNGTQTANTYLRRYNGQIMTATRGVHIPFNATIVGLSWTKGDANAGNIEIHRNGTSLTAIDASAVEGGVDLDVNFNTNATMSLYWASSSDTTAIQVAVHYRRRFNAATLPPK
jgi:hypothetical protein